MACSFKAGRRVYGAHEDCVRDDMAIRRLRRSIQFAKYIGCWTCGQPLFVCDRQRGQRCTQSFLVFDVCWAALEFDDSMSVEVLHALGAPVQSYVGDGDGSSTVRNTSGLHVDGALLRWFGEKSRLYS